MDAFTNEYLKACRLGEAEVMDRIAVFPVFHPGNGILEYLTFQDAHDTGKIKITEIDQHGSVPELKVINSADLPVLLVDGEELLGAKQNRVVNASILLRENSETVIPVSCTEQGRWSYAGESFSPSNSFLAIPVRARKNRTVVENLRAGREYRSDQGQVWNEISDFSQRQGVYSATGAHRDAVQAKIQDIEEYIKALPCQESQTGLMVFLNGKPAGLDFFSAPAVYRKMHAKLIRSYAVDIPSNGEAGAAPVARDAEAFIESIVGCQQTEHPSVGYGTDYRCQSGKMTGASLVYGEEVIHGAFFTTADGPETRMAGFNRRRR